VATRKKYRRRPGNPIVAVQLALKTAGFTYEKWGDTQVCKPGDWIVKSGEDTYTIDADVFARTYRQVGPGLYEKHGSVWAEQVGQPGKITTKEGSTEYEKGDYLVFNDEAGSDGYAVSRERFHELYEEAASDD
jgi:hypothetical protein